ncbi:MAG: zinc-ribbon domain-containing protein [Lachnospiraceae bacterium]|nr:zinc-ribbon domain-containing protein [Lachnospiraceae bacterium]
MNSTTVLILLILAILLGIAISIGLFFLFRELTCWYFKINKLLQEQRKTNAYLERIAMTIERSAFNQMQNPAIQVQPVQPEQPVQSEQPVQPAVTPEPSAESSVEPSLSQQTVSDSIEKVAKKCPNCGHEVSDNYAFCMKCGSSLNN